jgi:hypothetical protein
MFHRILNSFSILGSASRDEGNRGVVCYQDFEERRDYTG